MCDQEVESRMAGPWYDDNLGSTCATTVKEDWVTSDRRFSKIFPRVAPERAPPIPTMDSKERVRGKRRRCARASETSETSDPWSIKARTLCGRPRWSCTVTRAVARRIALHRCGACGRECACLSEL